MEWLRLDPTVLGSAEARRAWAIRKSKALAKRRMELESGAPRATGIPLPEALDATSRRICNSEPARS